MDLLKDVMPFLFLIAVYFIAPHTGGTNSDDCYSESYFALKGAILIRQWLRQPHLTLRKNCLPM